MEIKGTLEGAPLKNQNGDNLITLNIGPDNTVMHRIFNNFNDKPLLIKIDKFRKKRSNEQNAYFWKCIQALAAALGNDNWDQYLLELERYGKCVTLMIEKDAYPDLANLYRETKIVGEQKDPQTKKELYEVNCFYGSSSYNSKEFTRLIDGVISDMKDADVDIPVRGSDG